MSLASNFNMGKLAIVVFTVLILASSAVALYVRLTLDHSDTITQVFAVTSAGTYKHDGLAPSDGSTYTEVGWGTGNIVDSFYKYDGACGTHDLTLSVRTNWYLELTATVYLGLAVACVRSPQISSCCPSGGGGSPEQ